MHRAQPFRINELAFVYFVYILTNPSKTVFYTGVTNDLARRLNEHYESRGNNTTFTGKYSCFNLMYYEECMSVHAAIAREKEIKKWRREKKIWLIRSMNPEMEKLSFG
ncbi:MAG: GIY-YIG nuclease family protein [Chitinophagaceae bacterium]|nr:GIY-YIG nuclease family protein [Chitinophagaceae bacterium]